MIDPFNITKYNRTKAELEEVLLFWVLAAGKKASRATKALQNFLGENVINPFDFIKTLSIEEIKDKMIRCGIGCYNSKSITFHQLANSNLDLQICSAEDLEKIKGIGMKTSRCFIIHSRENANYAGLDTHILKYMKQLGYEVPKSTPTGKRYLKIEKQFLDLVKSSGKTLAEYDLYIWSTFASKKKD